MIQDERRRSGRIARAFMVRYQLPELQDAPWAVAPLRDFSPEGARFLSERKFSLGQRVLLQLLLPTLGEPLRLKARVAWTKPAPLKLTVVGVAFEELDRDVLEVISRAAGLFNKKPGKTL